MAGASFSGKYIFFSIIIPAHNEEDYIGTTLENISRIDYPRRRYEIIVVENGSSDRTLEVARGFEGGNIRVFSLSEGGISKAKNFGLTKISRESDWVIFLDADTFFKEGFLKSLNSFLSQEMMLKAAIGTTPLQPLSRSARARWWFKFYNLGHKLTKTSFSIQIARSSVAERVRYDESLNFGEDLKFIRQARSLGKFFYFKTDKVFTSVRRFEKEGWLKLFIKWNLGALLPESFKKKKSYKVIR